MMNYWDKKIEDCLVQLRHTGKADVADVIKSCFTAKDARIAELEGALEFISNGCLVPPDGGAPNMQDAIDTAKEALGQKESE